MRGEGRRPFVNNVYRRSLALAPPPPVPPSPPFPGVQLNSLSTYRRALLSERLEQARGADTASSSSALFFAHRRERNAGDEAQGTMGRRQGADTKREGEGEIRAPLALLGTQIPPSPFNACHEG